ncbi:hypothetical protein KIL84_005611 [Mauremys mutica]|uniref:Uncharacterized protein n=1 Tax=Mauremys mutica TaxID=74926 RepID=A0A9D3XH12_9SAUR|nr:hypothetical protein KIL84_005611 [Mauremys mutica]
MTQVVSITGRMTQSRAEQPKPPQPCGERPCRRGRSSLPPKNRPALSTTRFESGRQRLLPWLDGQWLWTRRGWGAGTSGRLSQPRGVCRMDRPCGLLAWKCPAGRGTSAAHASSPWTGCVSGAECNPGTLGLLGPWYHLAGAGPPGAIFLLVQRFECRDSVRCDTWKIMCRRVWSRCPLPKF